MLSNEKYRLFADALESSTKICVFTGAGISCPSGIPDFRSANGLFKEKFSGGLNPADVVSREFFRKEPQLFFEFYKNKMVYPDAVPNAAHRFFAKLEKLGKEVSVVTQNIDGFHQQAGNSRVFELHGSLHKNYCCNCGKKYSIEAIIKSDSIPRCECGGIIRPDVVLYGEMLKDETVDGAIDSIAAAEVLIVVGTSLVVYPAASFMRYFKGKTLVLINKSSTQYDSMADLVFSEDVIKTVEEVEKLMKI